MLKEVGFADVELVAETGFNSSAVTKGVALRARRPSTFGIRRVDTEMKDVLSNYHKFFDAAYAEGTIDRKTKHLIALSASLAAGCEQ